MRDYQIISPSLEGVLNHDSLLYEGIKRPLELLKILDGPSTKASSKAPKLKYVHKNIEADRKVLSAYFHDLFSLFLKKFSYFMVSEDNASDETIKMQAMLQEIIKIKGLLAGYK